MVGLSRVRAYAAFFFTAISVAFELIQDEHGMLDTINDVEVDVTDRYIVAVQPHVVLDRHIEYLTNRLAVSTNSSSEDGYEGVTHRFEIDDFKAYAGHFSPSLMTALHEHEDVVIIEPDQVWALNGCRRPKTRPADCPKGTSDDNSDDNNWQSAPLLPPVSPPMHHPLTEIQENAPRHLSLISHRHMIPGEDDKDYFYSPTNGNQTAYILDTGIMINHTQFTSRAHKGYNAAKTLPFDDLIGHGTHVAGLIGGSTYGAAKTATLIDVKVFERGSGTTATVLDGFRWAVAQINLHDATGSSVVNMSLGGCFSCIMNAAIEAAAAKGVSVVTAAGNSASRARWTRHAIAAGATDMSRRRAAFSNWGGRVSIFAPGVSITSAWIGAENATMQVSGTSQAAPLVAGVVLYLKGLGKLPDAVKTKEMLLALATRDSVKNLLFSPNLFLYNGSGK